MKRLGLAQNNLEPLIVAVALGAIALHIVNTSLFHIEAGTVERIVWAMVGVVAMAAAWHAYRTLPGRWRGAPLVAVGFPAVLFGLGVHASHAVQVGVRDSDFTGIPMLIAGVVLMAVGGTLLVRLIHTWWRRLFLVPAGVALGIFVIFPVGLAVFATNVARVECCTETPADRGLAYEDVTFETPQGREIGAWYVPSRNGAVVITVHGAGSNRATVLDEAEMLADHGYGLLMFDVEGYGDSEGRANAFGWLGARDVHAAVAYLATRGDVDTNRIGGLGLSMGGEVLLHAAGESDALKAIVAEGATGRTRDDFDEYGGFMVFPIWEVVETSIHLMTGEAPPPPLKDLVGRIAPRDVLLIAADIGEEQELMSMYVEIGGPTFELWSIPESKHVGAFDLHRAEYEDRVVAFFDESLLDERQQSVKSEILP